MIDCVINADSTSNAITALIALRGQIQASTDDNLVECACKELDTMLERLFCQLPAVKQMIEVVVHSITDTLPTGDEAESISKQVNSVADLHVQREILVEFYLLGFPLISRVC